MSREPTFTAAAQANIAGLDWQTDLALMRSGAVTPEQALAYCLDGAEPDRVQGWHDYVDALVALLHDEATDARLEHDDAVRALADILAEIHAEAISGTVGTVGAAYLARANDIELALARRRRADERLLAALRAAAPSDTRRVQKGGAL